MTSNEPKGEKKKLLNIYPGDHIRVPRPPPTPHTHTHLCIYSYTFHHVNGLVNIKVIILCHMHYMIQIMKMNVCGISVSFSCIA